MEANVNNRLSNINQTPPAVDTKVRDIVRKHGLFPTPAILNAIQEALQTNQSRPIPHVDMTENDRATLVGAIRQILKVTDVVEIMRDVSFGFAPLATSCKIPVNGTETVLAAQHLPNGRLKVIAVCSLTFREGLLRYVIIYAVSQKASEILLLQ